MADNIVGGLFGMDVGQLRQRQLENDRGTAFAISNAYRRPGARIGALVGANIAQGAARGLFGIQDPMIERAQKFEQILQQSQADSAGLSQPEMYLKLSKDLANAGFAREAQMVAQQAYGMGLMEQKQEWDIRAKQAEITKDYAQADAAGKEKQPEMVKLINARDAYLQAGNQEGANYIQNLIDKQTNIKDPTITPDNQAKQAVLDSFVKELGPVAGAKAYEVYQNELEQRKSAVQGTGSTLVNAKGETVGTFKKNGDFVTKNGRVVPEKEYSGYSVEQEAASELMNKLSALDDSTIQTAFGRAIDTTTNEALALLAPDVNNAQVSVQALRVKDTLDNLMALKGPTSDRDMKVVMSTFPSFGSSPQTMRDWIVRARSATAKFMAKRAESYGFDAPTFDLQEFLSSPTFRQASKKERVRAINEFRKLPSLWNQLGEEAQIQGLSAAEGGAARIKKSNGTEEFTYNGKTYKRPANATDDKWKGYMEYITSGGK
jgi:hypothetical protein